MLLNGGPHTILLSFDDMSEYLIRIEYWDKKNHKRIYADTKVSEDDVIELEKSYGLDALQFAFDTSRTELDLKIKELYNG